MGTHSALRIASAGSRKACFRRFCAFSLPCANQPEASKHIATRLPWLIVWPKKLVQKGRKMLKNIILRCKIIIEGHPHELGYPSCFYILACKDGLTKTEIIFHTDTLLSGSIRIIDVNRHGRETDLKQDRVLELFFRGLRGEDITVKNLAAEYNVSTKSISRDINDLKAFLADHRALVGNTELQYSYQEKCYRLYMDEFLTSKELFALIEVLIGARAFSKLELLALVEKMKRFTTPSDRPKLSELIRKELYHYPEVKHDCESVQAVLWQLISCIADKREISIEYYRADRKWVTHRLRPASVMFNEFYFYLIAFNTEGTLDKPLYFRVDRIKRITEHRKKFTSLDAPAFNEGLLRQRSLFMWLGKLRTIRFEFTGSAIQAVLDKLPTARVIERNGRTYTVEAEVYGDGIKMWILSQGHRMKVIAPDDFVEEMKAEITAMSKIYERSSEELL